MAYITTLISRHPHASCIVSFTLSLPTALIKRVSAPLQDVIEYRIAHFTETPGENPVVRMPESNNMDTWEEIFLAGVVRIPQEQARRLAEPSLPIPGDEDYYMISIEVFRQLHCLVRAIILCV